MELSSYMKEILKNTDIIDVVDGITRNTTSSLQVYQEKNIPYLDLQNEVFIVDDFYTFDGIHYSLYDSENRLSNKRISILLNQNVLDESLRDYLYFDNKESKLYDLSRSALRRDKYLTLVKENKVRKLMIFINSKFIHWSRIEVIIDYHYIYFLIDGIIKDEVEDIKVIYLPKEVEYYEGKAISSNKKLSFDKEGLLDMESKYCTIEFTNSNLEVEYFNTPIVESNIEKAKLTSSNLITFSNGSLSNESLELINFNTFKVNDNVETFIFWSNLSYTNTEHMDKISNKELARDIYKEGDNEIVKTIINPLDIRYNEIESKEFIKKLIEEDRLDDLVINEANIKKIVDYDRTLFNKLVKPVTINLVYTGLQVIIVANENNGKYIISCPDKSTDSGMLMFVNGKLYSLYKDIVYKRGQYYIPIDDIKNTDRVEFLFFIDVENLQYPFTPKEEVVDISIIDTDNVILLSPYIHPKIIWDTQSSSISFDDTLRFFVRGKTIVTVTRSKIMVIEDRGKIFHVTKEFGGDFLDATFSPITSNIFVLTEGNIIINYTQTILRQWAMRANVDGEIESIEYTNGNIDCKVGNKIYTIENVDGSTPRQSSIIKDITTEVFIKDPSIDFNGTPYRFISNLANNYILKQTTNDLSANKNIWYKIPYEKNEEDKIVIDKKYVGKELMAFSNKSFKYYGRRIDEYNVSGVILPQDFSYCKNWDRFMVFVNGRRLDQNSYAITTMKETDPFIHTALFTALPLEYNDMVDVFYLPRRLEDISTQATISASGYIKLPHTLLPYGFNDDTCLIFLNGKKVRYNITEDVHFYKIKLNENIGSLDHLNIVRIIFDETYSKLLKSTPSEWDVLMDKIPSVQINKLMNYNESVYDSPEDNYIEYQATIKTPVYEVLYNYFLSDPNSASDIQLYDFIDAGYGVDSNDVMIPGVFDATLQDKEKSIKILGGGGNLNERSSYQQHSQ